MLIKWMAWCKTLLSDNFDMKYFLFSEVLSFLLLAFKLHGTKETLLGHLMASLHCVFEENKAQISVAYIISCIYKEILSACVVLEVSIFTSERGENTHFFSWTQNIKGTFVQENIFTCFKVIVLKYFCTKPVHTEGMGAWWPTLLREIFMTR